MTRLFASLLSLLLVACGVGAPPNPAGTTDAATPPPGGDNQPDTCGDGVCTAGESCTSCAADCGACTDCTSEPTEPPPDGIDYATQIQPIFDSRCTDCHGDSGGLTLSSYDEVIAGGGHGAIVTPCDCADSILFQKLSPNPPFGDRMPDDGPYLSDSQIALICDWINQGAGQTYDPAACGAPEPPPMECADGCGDGTCSADEDCESCRGDCGTCEPTGDPDDTTPPEFAGVDEVEEASDAACSVAFTAANDDVTPAEEIVYDVFAGQGEDVDFSAPVATLEASDLAGADDTLLGVVALAPGERYELAVRARDAAGNTDTNTATDDCDLR